MRVSNGLLSQRRGRIVRDNHRRAAAASLPALRGVLGTLIRTEGRMASKLKIRVNGLVHNVTATLDTPLLYVLHNELHLHGPRFGCGLAQCGACSVLLDGKEIRSCVTPVAAVTGKAITTLEGMGALYSRSTTASAPAALHPLQQAWIDVQVPHCGYCQNGMMIQAADLLATTKRPTEAQIRTAMNGHLCRCGTYPRILTAIQKAAAVMAKGGK
jgi:aerobic-type carbon monoxide dehydrogenase small subunit (CoxS/CutS family)